MKTTFAKLLNLLTFKSKAQSVFRVSAGSTFTITKMFSNWIVEEWIMEDNSKIVFSDDIENWQLSASKVTIGNNCQIIGKGKNGNDGYSYTIKKCQGLTGGHGISGSQGINIDLTIGINSVNDLIITCNGGSGGNGGMGDKGNKGRNASCKKWNGAGKGHRGGVGGNAGNGGNGGDILIKYWFVNEIVSPESNLNKLGIRSSSTGGKKGLPGEGGEGGEGGNGKDHCIWGKHGKGDSGPIGPKGNDGIDGLDGKVENILIK